MKKLIVFLFTLGIIGSASAQTFMTEDEMMALFPGSTITGISANDHKTVWVQTYALPKKGKTKGKITGEFGGDPYKSKYYIKNGKWCENWGSGKACWDIERVSENLVQVYENGEPLPYAWEFVTQ